MADLHVVTAIGDPEFESFVARTLHSQGWNVLFRAVDSALLAQYLKDSAEIKPLLIYSNDIQGVNPDFISTISTLIERAVGFAGINKDESDGDLIERTHDAAVLMSRILTQGRAPLRQQGLSSSTSRRSRVIAVASASHGDGATTTAINCAIELNLLGKKVLLIDAHHRLPAVAILLGERNLNGSQPNRVSPLLEVFELTSENAAAMNETLIDACSRTDFVIIDCGLTPKAAEAITERRWENIFSHWIFENVDDIWVIASPRPVSAHSLQQFQSLMVKQSLRARKTFILNHRIAGKRGDAQEEEFLSLVAPSHPHAIRVLPLDTRGANSAEQERSILVESNPRGLLRKKYLELAAALTA
jgi:MinD-like ATPase involved in chromosome partitioning or flagellar assembly